MTTKRTHQPHWKDNTRTARSQKRTKADDAWASQISGGRYPTLRKLMTAIHNKEFTLRIAPDPGIEWISDDDFRIESTPEVFITEIDKSKNLIELDASLPKGIKIARRKKGKS